MLRTFLRVKPMIDQIIVKNSDDILVMKKTKEENAVAIKVLETQIEKVNEEIELTKKKIIVKDTKESKLRLEIKCNLCDKGFERFNDLENHIKAIHDNPEKFKCGQCSKDFVLKWRLKKHLKIHTQEFVQYCHYYNNDKFCPFEELGCKFLHEVAKDCKFGQKCKKGMCPRRHSEEERENKGDTKIDIDEEHFSENDEHDNIVSQNDSFVTSTPQKTNFQCEECVNQQQCTDCFVRQHVETGQLTSDIRKHKVHFKDYSRETY